MTTPEIEGFVRAQLELYGRIARAYENLRKVGSANITIGLVEARLQNLENNWVKFEGQHTKLVATSWDALHDHDYRKNDMFSVAEESYLQQKGLFLDGLQTLKSRQNPPTEPARSNNEAPAVISEAGLSKRTTLPRIQLPQFSGRYEEWPSFRDLFHSIIGKDVSTTEVEKLHYLKSCLKGEAELLIRSLPITDENFGRAWESLKDYYENKRLLVRSYISQFTALQKLKNESATELRKLYHCVLSTVGSLESIERPIKSSEDLFVHLVIELLDSRSRREWENAISKTNDPPSFSLLKQFLDRRLHTLESLQPNKLDTGSAKVNSGTSQQTRALHTRKQESKQGQCSLCHKDHYIMFCDKYKAKSAKERKQHIEASNLCFNCLGKHKVNECASQKTCSTCKARHHSTLHDAFTQASKPAVTSHLTNQPSVAAGTVLLATARVRVKDRFGEVHIARALVDQGSESSLISEALAQRLKLPRSPTSIAVFGVGGHKTDLARGLVSLSFSPLGNSSSMTVPALVLPRLSLYDGGVRTDRRNWTHLSGLELADPEFLATDPVEILLGADVYADILQKGLRKGEPGEPIAQRTSLGWILSGSVCSPHAPRRCSTHLCGTEEDLPSLVQRFWQQEEMSVDIPPLTSEESECEDHFRRTHQRNSEGRYVVRLPVSASLADLSSTRQTALHVLSSMERRFVRDARLHELYVDFLQEYEELGHMSPANQITSQKRVSYLPHHGVLRESSSSTKLRVVFNGSTTTPSGNSLNQSLLVGPNLLKPLANVLLRWRRHRYVFASDIEKMYRQILIHPDDRDLQRIVWRKSKQDNYQEYRLNTVTYGLACAPYLALRTLKQLADDEEERYPLGAAVLREDVYMDDILSGAATFSEAKTLQDQINGLCLAGGFPLRKWASNEPTLLEKVPANHRMQHKLRAWLPHETHSTLGLQWHPEADDFSFVTKPISVSVFTKRSVLSLTSRLFDPLGWLAPVVVSAKIAFQATWLQGIEWDAILDETSIRRWETYQTELPLLEQIRIPRWLSLEPEGDVEIHGFADASERAYAAVVYLKTGTQDSRNIRLIMAKTKVAPIKTVTLPRLELSAAALLARLASHVRSTLDLAGAPLYLWSDSTVTLGWIRGHPTRWKTYVANRVADIQSTVPDSVWNHVPGEDNPADCASRGLSPSELVNHQLWWQGPPWLRMGSSSWPSVTPSPEKDLPEERSRTHIAKTEPLQVEEPAELLRFSSLNRLLRVTAWCRRWLHSGELTEPTSSTSNQQPSAYILSVKELDAARLLWIRQVQSKNYADKLKTISRGHALAKSNQLTRLTPFLDHQGILRVGGRIKHAILAYDERHPAILPSESHLTKLIVEACHQKSLHGGVQLTLAMVRQRYWIPRGRAIVKRLIHRCVTCVRWRAATPQQLMGNLPRERVSPVRPFFNTGVDYAGPFQLRTTKGRGHRAYKGFVAVFVCLSTRAVHLEVVSDYSSEAFLAALRRFISRRGICYSIHSDCGTNFVGADAKLRALFAASNPEQRRIVEQLASEGIQWRFNPPAAPHFGGIWEAAVKSFKHHLRRVIGESTLTFEEMSTFLAQVEACLNSRPLQALSDDPEDVSALTPGHFLIGSALTAIPEPSLQAQPINKLTRWQMISKMKDHFWERWSREYLHSLVHRSKWWKCDPTFRVGRLCLIRNEITPPSRWPLARILRIHPGADGVVRVVDVRTAASEFTRPITKLILLPDIEAEKDGEAQS